MSRSPVALAKEMLQNHVTVEMFGGPDARMAYESFQRRYRRLFYLRRMCWRVALIQLPTSLPEYLSGRSRQVVRSNRSRAAKGGYRFERFDPEPRLDDIMVIHRSEAVRQGRPMQAQYLDTESVAERLALARPHFGVFERNGHLKAYMEVVVAGSVILFNRLMGHADALPDGVMYLLCSGVLGEFAVGEAATNKTQPSRPAWAMYDTFGGALGLRYFKQRLGFAPHRVSWKWVSTPCDASGTESIPTT